MLRRRRIATPWDEKSTEQRRRSSAGAICRFCIYREETGVPNEAAHYLYRCVHPSGPWSLWGPSCVDVVNEQGGCEKLMAVAY